MKEHYVTYEQAVKLKELGFDEPCYNFWALEPDGKPLIITSMLGDVRSSDLKGRDVAAPFLWQAQAWLREVKGIAINVIAHDGGKYHWEHIYLPNAVETDNFAYLKLTEYDSYELALSAGIDAALEILTNKDDRK